MPEKMEKGVLYLGNDSAPLIMSVVDALVRSGYKVTTTKVFSNMSSKYDYWSVEYEATIPN